MSARFNYALEGNASGKIVCVLGCTNLYLMYLHFCILMGLLRLSLQLRKASAQQKLPVKRLSQPSRVLMEFSLSSHRLGATKPWEDSGGKRSDSDIW